MSFLPENYEQPKETSDYCKFKDGTTKLRILTGIVTGYQDRKEKKPVNTRTKQNPIDPDKKPKFFWAMMVWNYDEELVQCLQITQKTAIDALYALNNDSDWGNPMDYDIKVTRTGKELETKYTVTPSNKKPIDTTIQAELDATVFNLENLFDGQQVITERTAVDLPF